MITKTMDAEQERWLEQQIKQAPDVFVLAYAGTSEREWKMIGMLTQSEFDNLEQSNGVEKLARSKYPSTLLVKVYKCNTTEETK